MENLYEPFSIIIEESSIWKKRSRKKNFFELVVVLDGDGSQCVNGFRYPYKKNSIFLLPSTKCHSYEIASTTRFLFIRFTPRYFESGNDTVIDYSSWFNRLNYIIGNYCRYPGELVKNEADRKSFLLLVQVLLAQYNKSDKHTYSILQSVIFSMLEIVARSIEEDLPGHIQKVDSRFGRLLNYIQYNLLDQEKIAVGYLSSAFNIAPSYFSEYFKRNAQESFQDFVLKSKLKIAEAKVLYSDQSFKEISNELGFTDSSHLNKMMRRTYKQSLSDIRKSNAGT